MPILHHKNKAKHNVRRDNRRLHNKIVIQEFSKNGGSTGNILQREIYILRNIQYVDEEI